MTLYYPLFTFRLANPTSHMLTLPIIHFCYDLFEDLLDKNAGFFAYSRRVRTLE